MALGGQLDKSGSIRKDVIASIIKSQFELTFKIDELLESCGDRDSLDYEAFSQIFMKVEESQRDLARSSFTLNNERTSEEDGGVKVKYHDFETWLFLNGA